MRAIWKALLVMLGDSRHAFVWAVRMTGHRAHESMNVASSFIEAIERRQSLKVVCSEEIACRQKWIKFHSLKNWLSRSQKWLRSKLATNTKGKCTPMKATPLAIPDVILLESKVFSVDRRFFIETFNRRKFEELTGRDLDFVQGNHLHKVLANAEHFA